MSSEIRPEDIEAAIAAAEQRRRSRLGGAAEAAGRAAPSSRRPVIPERILAGAPAGDAALRERPTPASTPMADNFDDSWLDQPARPRPSAGRVANLPDGEVVWESETGRRGLALPLAIGVVALIVFGSILWWAYSSDTQEAGVEVPVIVAEETPIKVKPADEGGLEVPDQDKLVYDNIAEGDPGAGKVEQILPGPEEPVAPPQPVTPAATAEPAPLVPADQGTNTGVADVTPTPAAPLPEAVPALPAATTPPASVAPTEPAAPAQPAAPALAAAAPAASAPAPAPATPAKAATGGSWKIQLAAVKTEGAAKQEWGRMQKAHLDLLGDMRLTVQRADLGTKGIFFRIQAGPLPDRTTAEDVCAELKAGKQPCIVVKP